MGRRTFGAVRKLPSGRWQASYLDPISRRRVPGPQTFRTKADANAWLATAQIELERGESLDPSGRRRTFGDYATVWLSGKTNLRQSTLELYDWLLRGHILPTFNESRLVDVDATAVRHWNAEIRSGSISDTTAAKAYRLMRQIMRAAVDDRLIRTNPCRIKGAAVERSAKRVVPTTAQVLELTETIHLAFRPTVLLAAFGGLRRGEILGLARQHLELVAQPTVRVERSLVQTDRDGFVLQPPKTAAGIRTVSLPQTVGDELETHLDQFVPLSPDAFVFAAEYADGLTFRHAWETARNTVGATCTFHDLRHYAGTETAAAGASIRESMARLGHASPDAALRYQHAIAERDRHLADTLDDRITLKPR